MLEKIEKFQLLFISIILALAIIISVFILSKSIHENSGITVTGSSYKIVNSDKGSLGFEIVNRSPVKSQAYQTIKLQIPIVKKFLLDEGFDEADIEIKPINSYENYKYSSNGSITNEIAYYNFNQPFLVKSGDVQKIKKLSNNITKLNDQNININVYQPEYFYSKLSDDKIALLEEAAIDAKQRAKAMLKATRNRPGKIKMVKMGVFQITPSDSNNVSDMGINDTSSIEKKITSVVNVVFEIK